jgi:uncharacterized membrane protein
MTMLETVGAYLGVGAVLGAGCAVAIRLTFEAEEQEAALPMAAATLLLWPLFVLVILCIALADCTTWAADTARRLLKRFR